MYSNIKGPFTYDVSPRWGAGVVFLYISVISDNFMETVSHIPIIL